MHPFQKRDALNHLTYRRQSETMKASNSVFHSINGLRYHLRTWGDPGKPQLFLLHGWMDVSASFQFWWMHYSKTGRSSPPTGAALGSLNGTKAPTGFRIIWQI